MCVLCVYIGAESDRTTTVNCTCEPGFIGDGFTCNANMWLALSELSAAKHFYRVRIIYSVCIETAVWVRYGSYK